MMKTKLLLLFSLFLTALSAQNQSNTPNDPCSGRCKGRKKCLCECAFEEGRRLRREENYPEAIKQLQVAARWCKKKDVRAVIDTIRRKEQRMWVEQGGRYAIANGYGELISPDSSSTPFRFMDPQPFRNGIAIVAEDTVLLFVNKNGKTIDPRTNYTGIIPAEGGLYYLRKRSGRYEYQILDGITGASGSSPLLWFSHAKGNEVFSLKTTGGVESVDSLSTFLQEYIPGHSIKEIVKRYTDDAEQHGYPVVTNNQIIIPVITNFDLLEEEQELGRFIETEGKWALTDHSGKIISEKRFDNYGGFGNRNSVSIGGKWGMIDSSGKQSIPIIYDYLYPRHDGTVWARNDHKTGLLDSAGQVIAPLIYNSIDTFAMGRALVKKGELYGFIAKDGKEKIPTVFKETSPFRDGYALVRDAGRWSFIDTNGREVVSPVPYRRGNPWCEKSRTGIMQTIKNWKYGITDSTGRILVPFIYDDLYCIHNEDHLFIAGLNKKYGCIDTSGSPLIPVIYDNVSVSNGVAIVKSGTKHGCYLPSGQKILEVELQEVSVGKAGIIVKKDNKYGFYDRAGSEVFPVNYEAIYDEGNKINVKKDGILHTYHYTENNQLIKYKEFDAIYKFKDGLALAVRNGKFGYIDSAGREIVPIQYDYVWNFINNLAAMKIEDKYGVVGTDGKEVIKPQFENLYNYGHHFVAQKDGMWGILDTTGTVRYDFKYRGFDLKLWSYDIILLREKESWLLVDRKNLAQITPLQYDSLAIPVVYNARNYLPAKKAGKWGLLDRQANEVIPFEFSAIRALNDNRFAVMKDSQEIFYNINGKTIIQLDYDAVFTSTDHVAKVKKGNKYGFIDLSGKTVVPCMYEDVDRSNEDNIFKVKEGGKWGFADSWGRMLLPAIYDTLKYFDYNGNIIVKKAGKWGYTDSTGRIIIPFMYDAFDGFAGGKALVKITGKQGEIDTIGRILIPVIYDTILGSPYYPQKLRKVQRDGKFGCVNSTGKEVIPVKYDQIGNLSQEYIIVKMDKKYGVSDTNGIEIVPLIYDEIQMSQAGLFFVKNGGKWGVINNNNEVILPLIYKSVESFDHGLIRFWTETGWGITDTNGQILVTKEEESEYYNNSDSYYSYDEKYYINNFPIRGKLQWLVSKDKNKFFTLFADEVMHSDSVGVVFRKNNKTGFLFIDENTTIPPIYDEIANVHDEWVMVRQNNKWGWADHRGNIKIPCRYDAATPFTEQGWAKVYQYGLQFRINKKGEMIWEK